MCGGRCLLAGLDVLGVGVEDDGEAEEDIAALRRLVVRGRLRTHPWIGE